MRNVEHNYPAYARSERIADAAMHTLGVVGALIGAAVLIWLMFGGFGAGQNLAFAVYGLALIATFTASAFYHMTPWEGLRPTLRRVDHAAIYLKIAGTYTPLVVMMGTGFAYQVLGIVWALAVVGMAQKLFFWRAPGRFGAVLYLAMGWMSIALIWGLIPILPTVALVLLGLGGALYSFGVIFFGWESLKFSNAIWHGFVVAASACFFLAILIAAISLS